jgi:phage FluMu protein Com
MVSRDPRLACSSGRTPSALVYTPVMSSRAVRCQGCGGPLHEAPQDVSTITCPFCGIVNEAAARPSVTVKLDVREAAAHLGSRVKLAIGTHSVHNVTEAFRNLL